MLKAAAGIAAAVRWVAIVLSMLMIVFLLLQIFFRYVVGHALSWSEEMALLTFAWVVLLLAGVGVVDNLHVRLTVIVSLFPAVLREWVERLLLVAIGVFGVFLVLSGWRYFDQTRGQLSAAVNYPIEILHSAPLVCGGLITLMALARLLQDFADKSADAPDEPPP